MCWSCDNPDGDFFGEVVFPAIEEHGWFVQSVEGRPRLTYTVGLTEHGLAELVVTGLPWRTAGSLLNLVAHGMVVHGRPQLAPGEQLAVEGRRLEAVHLPHPDAHLFTAVAVYGDRVRATQLVWADDRGTWPWYPGHRASRGGQPVLGPPRRPSADGLSDEFAVTGASYCPRSFY